MLSAFALDKATRECSILIAILQPARTPPSGTTTTTYENHLPLPLPKTAEGEKRGADFIRKAHPVIEPLQESGAPEDQAAIHLILARCDTLRIKHYRRSTWVAEVAVQWEPEQCTLQGVLEEQRLGLDITLINSLE